MKWHKKLTQTGDTIIEVLIVLAILGLAFSVSTATARKGLSQARTAQEHSQAMGIGQAQIEKLRLAINNNVSFNTPTFCMTSTSAYTHVNATVTIDPATGDLNAQSTGGCQEGIYSSLVIALAPNGSNPAHYKIFVFWEGTGSGNQQTETFNYKTQLNTTGINPTNGWGFTYTPPSGGGSGSGGGFTIAPPPPPIAKITVKKIPPAAGNTTPSCAAAATADKAGTSVVLNNLSGGAGFSKTTDSSSIATFDNLTYGSKYRASITAPSGYQLCTSPPAGYTANNFNPPSFVAGDTPYTYETVKVRPVCTPAQIIGWNPGYWTVGPIRPDFARNFVGNSSAYPYLGSGPYDMGGGNIMFYYMWWDQAPTYWNWHSLYPSWSFDRWLYYDYVKYYGFNSVNGYVSYTGTYPHMYMAYQAIWVPATPIYSQPTCPS